MMKRENVDAAVIGGGVTLTLVGVAAINPAVCFFGLVMLGIGIAMVVVP